MEKPPALRFRYAIAAGIQLKNRITKYKKVDNESLPQELNKKPEKSLPEDMEESANSFVAVQDELQQMEAKEELSLSTVDHTSDRVIGRTATIARAVVQLYENPPILLEEDEKQRQQDATAFLTLYPSDLRDVTNIEYVEEYVALDGILQCATQDTEMQERVQRLGMTPDFNYLGRLHVHYGQKLGITQETLEVQQKLNAWRDAYFDLMVVAAYHGRKDPELKALIFDPYYEQLENQREADRREQELRKKKKAAKAKETEEEKAKEKAAEKESPSSVETPSGKTDPSKSS